MTQAAGMPCPVCKIPFVMSDRQGVEIDYCPQCRGVWLDRGELDKIIERSTSDIAPVADRNAQPQHSGYQQQTYSADSHGFGHSSGHKKRKKSFLEELFD